MKFHAASLADIAAHFDQLAVNADDKRRATGGRRPTKEMYTLEREAAVWRDAAAILRETEIKAPRERK